MLRLAKLQSRVDNEQGLDMAIEEGGGNLSIGEQQLVSLARALLRKSKLVLIDEATANVDYQTDAVIQQALAEHPAFQASTMVHIAICIHITCPHLLLALSYYLTVLC